MLSITDNDVVSSEFDGCIVSSMLLRQDEKSRGPWNPEELDRRHPTNRLRSDGPIAAPAKTSPFLSWSELVGER